MASIWPFNLQFLALFLTFFTLKFCSGGQHSWKMARYIWDRKLEIPPRPSEFSSSSVNQPYFDNSTDNEVTVQLRKSAFLECKVKNLGDRSIAWVRQIDWHILTVDNYTYTRDLRFQPVFKSKDHYLLEIKFAKLSDAGVYECQVSSEPKISKRISLTVIVAKVVIEQSPDIYVKSGSKLKLKCLITHHSSQPPIYIFWYHNNQVIKYNNPRGGITVESSRNVTTISEMNINEAQEEDSGNYSCKPPYADPAYITVHILNGEKQAAMQRNRQEAGVNKSSFIINAIILCIQIILKEVISS